MSCDEEHEYKSYIIKYNIRTILVMYLPTLIYIRNYKVHNIIKNIYYFYYLVIIIYLLVYYTAGLVFEILPNCIFFTPSGLHFQDISM